MEYRTNSISIVTSDHLNKLHGMHACPAANLEQPKGGQACVCVVVGGVGWLRGASSSSCTASTTRRPVSYGRFQVDSLLYRKPFRFSPPRGQRPRRKGQNARSSWRTSFFGLPKKKMVAVHLSSGQSFDERLLVITDFDGQISTDRQTNLVLKS